MRYLVVDGELQCTGIRDEYEGDYLEPESLGLSQSLTEQIKTWVGDYDSQHFKGFKDSDAIDLLDNQGIDIARAIKEEMTDVKVRYYSHAKATSLIRL